MTSVGKRRRGNVALIVQHLRISLARTALYSMYILVTGWWSKKYTALFLKCTQTHSHTYTTIHLQKHKIISTCTHTCACAHAHTCTHMHMHACMHSHVHGCTCPHTKASSQWKMVTAYSKANAPEETRAAQEIGPQKGICQSCVQLEDTSDHRWPPEPSVALRCSAMARSEWLL